MKQRHSRVRLTTLAAIASGLLGASAFACGTLLGTDVPNDPATPDAGVDSASKDDAMLTPEPVDPNEEQPVVLIDAGCLDAAFAESFEDASFGSLWSTTKAAGGKVDLDNSVYLTAPSLRARVDSQPSNFAYASRAMCPASSGIAKCSFGLRIDSTTDGDIGILDLRGKGATGGYAVARVKAREILFLTPGEDGGQRVDRLDVPFLTLANKAFRVFELEVNATTFIVKLEGATIATLPVPAAGLALDEVRAGISYMTGSRDPGWDVRIDELRCTFE